MLVDTVLVGGRILTGRDFTPESALAIHDGRIVAIGPDAAELRARRRIELGDACVVPGFHDAHNHMAWFGMTLDELDLGVGAVGSVDDVYAAVQARAARQPPGTWIIGNGYDQNKLLGGHPTMRGLDRAAPEHQVWLKHTSGHMSVVNGLVFSQLALDDLPDGGDVPRTPDGTPTGLLREQAQLLLRPLTYPLPVDLVARALAKASRHYVSEGICSVQEAGIGGGWIGRTPLELAAYQDARAAGALGVRVTLMPVVETLHALASGDDGGAFGLDLGMRTGFGDDRLRIGAVKIFADGSLIGRTAAMHADFADAPGESGYFQTQPDVLRETIRRAHAAGWQIATHAIGDRAVSEVISAYESALALHPRTDHRHRIEHCAVTSPDDVGRIARLGLVPVPQGRFVHELGDGMRAAIGPDRAHWAYRQRTFLDAGVVVPGSSDRPVVNGAPLLGLRDLMERRTAVGDEFGPHEQLTAVQALRAYTLGSAYSNFTEDRLGTVEVGKYADLAVLTGDPLAGDRFDGLSVLATLIGGEFAYDAAGLC